MTRITVLGGTGYAGGHIVREAAARGHEVTSVSRTLPEDRVDGVTYRTGDALDPATIAQVAEGADVVVHALAPRGPLAGRLEDVARDVTARASDAGARLGVVGGAGSLLVSPDGPRVADGPDFPEAFHAEALTMGSILDDLRTGPADLDWFMLSPSAGFGGFAPGERTGSYRTGDDVLLVDDAGESFISGEDFAIAFLDEIENPAHRRARFTVGY
ncbi:NAD(P)-dependent oxidoreductase [Sanguibacter sp. HDW7]|uniref:NAD(P)-dependent oxidoreductase n=1 Tax=Sanguibacter sp. HDW7 TaxID=2714931 RepID=UPI00140B2567|nr:NAD(P)H-binding protein [Sanguibacter sp. HDW7]QIK84667.1 NAD(P)H-binding protein [Sanguibacter sp. HDW7]